MDDGFSSSTNAPYSRHLKILLMGENKPFGPCLRSPGKAGRGTGRSSGGRANPCYVIGAIPRDRFGKGAPALSPIAAWMVLIFGFALPLLHVAVSPKSGPWKAPQESSCPMGPRWGWLVIVLFLGPVGWLMFMSKRRRASPPE